MYGFVAGAAISFVTAADPSVRASAEAAAAVLYKNPCNNLNTCNPKRSLLLSVAKLYHVTKAMS
jgi:hypothetical protein